MLFRSDRDAFLYVSDFFEDNDEYDKIVTSVEEKILKMEKGPGSGGTPPPPLDAPPPAELPAPELSAEAPAAPAVAAQPAPAPLAAPDQFARRRSEVVHPMGRLILNATNMNIFYSCAEKQLVYCPIPFLA